MAHRATVIYNESNPTTGGTFTIPATVQTGDDLYISLLSRNHTAVDAFPTVTDNDTGGNTWANIAGNTEREATLWYKKATSGTASKTVTVAGTINSTAGILSAYSGGAAGDPTTNISVESNSSADESHAGFTPDFADSEICFSVFNVTNDINVTDLACTNPGSLEPERGESLSTGGGDCAVIHGSATQSGGPTATGNLTWAQGNAATKSIAWAIKPAAGSVTLTASKGNITLAGK